MSIAHDGGDWECHFVKSCNGTWCGFAGAAIQTVSGRPVAGVRVHTPWMPNEHAARIALDSAISMHG